MPRRAPNLACAGGLGLLLLLLGATAARGEVGAALQTAIPLTLGLELAVGGHLGWEVALAGGFTPPTYVGVIQRFAADQQSSDVIQGTLDRALSAQALARVFPLRGFGLFLVVGYDVFRVSGNVAGPGDDPGTGAQALGAAAQGIGGGFDPQDPGKPPGQTGGGTAGSGTTAPQQRRDVSSTIQALHGGVGYRQFFGPAYVQGELAVLKAIKASSSPAEWADYLNSTYTDNLLVPYLSVGVGFRL